jgi:hypothetical protein
VDPKEPPPANEDRKTVDPDPPGVDPERKERRPDKADGGPESEPESREEAFSFRPSLSILPQHRSHWLGS